MLQSFLEARDQARRPLEVPGTFQVIPFSKEKNVVRLKNINRYRSTTGICLTLPPKQLKPKEIAGLPR